MSFEERDCSEREGRQERKRDALVLDASDVDEALAVASRQWGVPVEALRANVLGSERRVLGLFGTKLKVEVEPVAPLLLIKGRAFIDELLALMGMEARAVIQEDGMIEIEGRDAADHIVRRYGDPLRAIEHVANLALRDPSTEPRMRLDSGGYRERRARTLERLAEATAREAVDYGRPIRLEPMSSWERWIIHETLKDREDVRTESVGEPPMRKVVVMPKYGAVDMDDGYRPRPRARLRGRRY